MNVFEDLVTELQEENLLEETVIGDRRRPGASSFGREVSAVLPREVNAFSATEVEIETAANFAAVPAEKELPKPYAPQNQRQQHSKEFFKKRASTEISSLQIVEHVLTGIEREYLKIVPRSYDDFKAKKALNNFLQIPDSVNSEEHAEAEFELLQQTEGWCSALAERDKNVPVSALRQFCENTKPALSSQAMLATARFYRNLPYSEGVRSKFDFIVTRLFSRSNEVEQRLALFSREETLNHIKTLYAEWSSVPLYATRDDDSDVVMAALSFDDLAIESENAATFDQLIHSDFFCRVRSFKESISELFFAPAVTAAAIDANVRIGNSYIRLIGRERQKMDADSIQTKYGDVDGLMISDATARTLDLVDVLRTSIPQPEAQPDAAFEQNETWSPPERRAAAENGGKPKAAKTPGVFFANIKEQIAEFNRSLLIGCGILIFSTVGLVVYSNYFASPAVSNAGVVEVAFDNPMLDEQIVRAKVSNNMLHAQVRDTWDTLPKERRLELLRLIRESGSTRGFDQVNLIDKEGKPAGFASANRLEVPTF